MDRIFDFFAKHYNVVYVALFVIQISLFILALIKKRDVFWISLFVCSVGSAAVVFAMWHIVGVYALLAYGALFYAALTKRAMFSHDMPHTTAWTAVYLIATVGVMIFAAANTVLRYITY